MQSIKETIKKLPVLFVILFCFASQNAAFAEESGSKDGALPRTLNLSGLYLGFFPCPDCQGVKTTLALNANNSYVYITQYVGKSDREFVEKGKFEVSGDGNNLILTPKKGATTVQQYLIDDNMLVKLDDDGNRITSDGADRYILRRKDVISSRKNIPDIKQRLYHYGSFAPGF